MIPLASPLSILDFAITSFEFRFITPTDGGEVDVKTLFSNYNIDIDFGIHSNEIMHVYMQAKINCDEQDKQPGRYHLSDKRGYSFLILRKPWYQSIFRMNSDNVFPTFS